MTHRVHAGAFIRTNRTLCLTLAATLLAMCVSGSVAAQGSPYDPAAAAPLRWRYIGPVGNRVASVSGSTA